MGKHRTSSVGVAATSGAVEMVVLEPAHTVAVTPLLTATYESEELSQTTTLPTGSVCVKGDASLVSLTGGGGVVELAGSG